ncbi:hypothetical protein HPB47_012183 [Ixodes persulcatus]|uniref:Uncharacterized protein n=1 Tax=Ixodes persulcatus TaxID=34615 RepID=A0AC60NUB2_IXOPE|nr:hypothetical protein HPB47_012183 [Ixodes persulcatus]
MPAVRPRPCHPRLYQQKSYVAALQQPKDTRSRSQSRAAATEKPQSPRQSKDGRDDPGLPALQQTSPLHPSDFAPDASWSRTAPDALEDSESSAPSSTTVALRT